MGHIINASGLSPDSAKLRVLSIWPVPATVRDVQSFLGFVNFYEGYTAGLTRLTAFLYPLTAGSKGIEKIFLDADKLVPFNCLKQALVANPQLAHPDLS